MSLFKYGRSRDKSALVLLGALLTRIAVSLFLAETAGCSGSSTTPRDASVPTNGSTSDATLIERTDGCVPGDRPNILMILSDDHAYQAISAYGSIINQTPNIDRLANQGVVFTNAMVENSICAPSRAAILTGKFSHLNGQTVNGDIFDGGQPTFPKLLQQAGYQTALMGKWHLKSLPTGFDQWNILPGQGDYYNPQMFTAEGVKEHTGYVTDIITDYALQWLRETRDPYRPFLLMVHHKATHRDWQPPLRYLDLYDDQEIPEPSTLFDDYATRTSAAFNQHMMIANDLNEWDLKLRYPDGLTLDQLTAWDAAYGAENTAFLTTPMSGDDLVRWKYQRYIKDYLRTVVALDDGIGRILDYLDDTCLADNTVVIYSSDQGFFLGEHGWFDKRWMYEQSLRTPLIARWPGVTPENFTNDDLVQNIDLAETFLEIAGAEIPSDMQGRSLVPLLRGETPDDWRDAIYYHYYEYPDAHEVEPHYGVRTLRYKLIHFYREDVDEWELYDLLEDPEELLNLYDDISYATVQSELERKLEALREQYQDPVP